MQQAEVLAGWSYFDRSCCIIMTFRRCGAAEDDGKNQPVCGLPSLQSENNKERGIGITMMGTGPAADGR